MPWPIYLALKQLFPSGRKRPSFFFFISVMGVALGVMILVIVQSVMGGFGQTYRDLLVATNGHVRCETGGVFYDWPPLLELLEQDPAVAAVAPYAQGIVMLQHRHRPAFPYLRGIDPARENAVIPMDRFLQIGQLSDLDDDSVLLSRQLAGTLRAGVGDTVEVYTPLMIERLKHDEVLLPREFRVAGLYETGWNQFDSSTMIGTLAAMQDLYGLREGVHGLAVRLREGENEAAFAARWNRQLPPPVYAATWLDSFQDFLWVLQLEKNVMLFLLLFIVLVAAFAIAVAQLLTVVRKTREIGLLGALGGRPLQMAACYCFQGFFIGLLGTGLGFAAGLLALHYRNPIIHAFAALTDSQEVLIKYYQFADLPVRYARQDFLVIGLSALLLATLAGFLPALRAARLRPAEALRLE